LNNAQKIFLENSHRFLLNIH